MEGKTCIEKDKDGFVKWYAFMKGLNIFVTGRRFFLLTIILALAVGSAGAMPNLKNLTEVGSFTTASPHDAEFFKNDLYIADGNSLQIYNTIDPERPTHVDTFTSTNYPGYPDKVYGLSVSENMLYVAAGPGWIYVFNISDPEKPKKMYQINYLNVANDVAVSGKYMYVADTNNGMLIFDLTDKMNPGLMGVFYVVKSSANGSCGTSCWQTGWGGTSVAVSGNYAFLNGANRQGFYIINVADPANPIQTYHSAEVADSVEISGKDVYLARSDRTVLLDLLNVSNPYAPTVYSRFSISDTVEKSIVAIHPPGDYIYVAVGDIWHIYRAPTQPITTIEKAKSMTEIQNSNIVNNPVFYGIVFVILAVIIYWFWSHKMKK